MYNVTCTGLCRSSHPRLVNKGGFIVRTTPSGLCCLSRNAGIRVRATIGGASACCKEEASEINHFRAVVLNPFRSCLCVCCRGFTFVRGGL